MNGCDPPYRIAVVGAGDASAEETKLAQRLGAYLGGAGAVVVTGGRGGVMEAASRGATEAGGLTLGILPGRDPTGANRWVRIPVATGLGEARNVLVVGSAEAVVAVGGGWGTLSEISLARKMDVPVALLGDPVMEELSLPRFREPGEAAEWALREASRGRGEG